MQILVEYRWFSVLSVGQTDRQTDRWKHVGGADDRVQGRAELPVI